MSLRNLVMGLMALPFVVVACGGDDEVGGPQFKYPTEASFCSALAAAVCNGTVVKACYGSDDASLAKDRENCIAKRSLPSVCREAVTGLADIAPTYNPAAAEACIAKQQAIYGDAELTRAEIDAAHEACIQVFHEGKSAGSSCKADVECETPSGLRCIVRDGEGTCAIPKPIANGENCEDAAAQCPDESFCGEAVSGLICQSKAGEGKTCSPAVPCQSDLLCGNVDMEGIGTCEPKLSNGEECTTGEQCAGTFCEKAEGAAPEDTGQCTAVFTIFRSLSTCDSFK